MLLLGEVPAAGETSCPVQTLNGYAVKRICPNGFIDTTDDSSVGTVTPSYADVVRSTDGSVVSQPNHNDAYYDKCDKCR